MAEVQIQDVAEHAGVSVSTVSNVLNGRAERMRPDTFQRVIESIRVLRYQPNQVARHLKTGRTPMLGLLVPSIANPFFGSLAREIDDAAQKRGYHLLLGNTYRDPEKEREFLDDLVSFGIRGVITTSSIAAPTHYMPFIERGMTIVSFDSRESSKKALPIDYVSIDNFHAGYAATRHLIDNGHRAIAYVTAPGKTLSRVDRRAGYVAAMDEAGLAREARVFELGVSTSFADSELGEVGRRVAMDIAALPDRPTAVVALNDMLAIGLLSGLHAGGLRVPEDVSVVGIDDLYLDSFIAPALSSVRQPLPEIAEAMVERIVKRLADPALDTTECVFKPRLIERESVRALAAATSKDGR